MHLQQLHSNTRQLAFVIDPNLGCNMHVGQSNNQKQVSLAPHCIMLLKLCCKQVLLLSAADQQPADLSVLYSKGWEQ